MQKAFENSVGRVQVAVELFLHCFELSKFM